MGLEEENNSNYELLPRAVNSLTVDKSWLDLSKTIKSPIAMTAIQKKAFNAVQWAVQSYASRWGSQDKFHAHFKEKNLELRMSRQDFLRLIDHVNSNNDDPVIQAIDKLTDLKVRYDNHLKGNDRDAGFTNLFMHANMSRGIVSVVIPPDTRKALVSDVIATRIDIIRVARQLTRRYAISLYQLLHVTFESSTTDPVVEYVIEETALRTALNVRCKSVNGKLQFSYPQTGEFNKKVLKPAIEEINKKDFEFEVKARHKRRQGVVHWTFTITKTEYKEHTEVSRKHPMEIAFIRDRLESYKLKDPDKYLLQITSEREMFYFKYCVDVVDKEITDKRGTKDEIRNQAGMFVRVHENNRKAFDKHYIAILNEKKRTQKLAQEEEERNLREQERIHFLEQRTNLLTVYWNELGEGEKLSLANDFCQSGLCPRGYDKEIREQGIESAADEFGSIRGPWYEFLQAHFDLTDEKIEETIQNATLKATF